MRPAGDRGHAQQGDDAQRDDKVLCRPGAAAQPDGEGQPGGRRPSARHPRSPARHPCPHRPSQCRPSHGRAQAHRSRRPRPCRPGRVAPTTRGPRPACPRAAGGPVARDARGPCDGLRGALRYRRSASRSPQCRAAAVRPPCPRCRAGACRPAPAGPRACRPAQPRSSSCPRSSNAATCALTAGDTGTPAGPQRQSPLPAHACRSRGGQPRPVCDSTALTAGKGSPGRAPAPHRRWRGQRVRDRPSAAAVRNRSAPGPVPSSGVTSVTTGRPWVMVPVLSNAAAQPPQVSRCAPPLMSTPWRAACATPASTVAGVPSARAHGDAATSSVMAPGTLRSGTPNSGGTTINSRATPMTDGTNMREKRSIVCCVGDFCALGLLDHMRMTARGCCPRPGG